MPTPHINAEAGAFADTILFPGDPLRAKYIAENYLDKAVLVTDVRNMLGYTGYFKGKRISVMGHGMGIPSCSIYARELIADYGVKNLIRIGTCGGILRDVKLRDIVVAMGASTDSQVNRTRYNQCDFSAIADYDLLAVFMETAKERQTQVRVGNIHTTDLFYSPDAGMFDAAEKMNVLAVDMEAAGLYGVATEYGAKSLCVLTVSDHVRTGEKTTSDERQNSFNEMLEVTLEAAIKL